MREIKVVLGKVRPEISRKAFGPEEALLRAILCQDGVPINKVPRSALQGMLYCPYCEQEHRYDLETVEEIRREVTNGDFTEFCPECGGKILFTGTL